MFVMSPLEMSPNLTQMSAVLRNKFDLFYREGDVDDAMIFFQSEGARLNRVNFIYYCILLTKNAYQEMEEWNRRLTPVYDGLHVLSRYVAGIDLKLSREDVVNAMAEIHATLNAAECTIALNSEGARG